MNRSKRVLMILAISYGAIFSACTPMGVVPSDAGSPGLRMEASLDVLSVGSSTMQIELYDVDTGVVGATLSVDPQMPTMGHGSDEVAIVTEIGDGFYEAAPIGFTMPGAWEIRVVANISGTDEPFEKIFRYEVD
ncbi:MAG: hypothetical protein GY822_04905 [Deltaproteobacteria bacterium]|nr:hypothetical protein [Deltaproteobacteria bacterium]